MNIIEKNMAERELSHKMMMEKNPVYASLYQAAQQRAVEKKRCEEILSSYGSCVPEKDKMERPLTDEELRINEILKNY